MILVKRIIIACYADNWRKRTKRHCNKQSSCLECKYHISNPVDCQVRQKADRLLRVMNGTKAESQKGMYEN